MQIMMSRRAFIRITALAGTAAVASCAKAQAPVTAGAPEMPTVDLLEKTLVPGMTLAVVQEWLHFWKMESVIYLPDKSSLRSVKMPLPIGTIGWIHGQRTLDVYTGRIVEAFVFIDANYGVLKTIADERQRSS
jgi:hypothetical protein